MPYYIDYWKTELEIPTWKVSSCVRKWNGYKFLGFFSTSSPKTWFIWNINKAPLGVKCRLKGEHQNLRLVLWLSANHLSSSDWNESTHIFTNQGSGRRNGCVKWPLLPQHPWMTLLFVWTGFKSSDFLLDYNRYQTSSTCYFPPFNCLYLEIQAKKVFFFSLLLPLRSLTSAVVASPLQKDKNQMEFTQLFLVGSCLQSLMGWASGWLLRKNCPPCPFSKSWIFPSFYFSI